MSEHRRAYRYAEQLAHTTEDLRFCTESHWDGQVAGVLLSISAVQGARRIGEDLAFTPNEARQLAKLLKKAAKKVAR